ncbi:MAG: chemotaxis protein CheX [Zoogloeaceae bacterium]|jgi:chemotaxis protein CheX|nr:chemotaxis protein CheX [Zoogloeaceae bacterium]
MSDIDEKDIHSFVDAVSAYFYQTTGEKAEIRSAYLVESGVSATTFELIGHISLSGSFSGRVYFSASRGMVRHLLLMMKELNHTEEHLLDTVGEVANTIAGNARQHFGDTMEISVPVVTATTHENWLNTVVSPRSYVILIKWKQYKASVVVDIQRIAK